MRKFIRVFSIQLMTLATIMAVEAPSFFAYADVVSDCLEGKGEQRVSACSEIIKTGRIKGEKIDSKNLAVAYNNRGIGYYSIGAMDVAIMDYSKALELSSEFDFIFYNRGLAYQQKGELDRAIADYDRALKLNPKDASRYLSRGAAYEERGDLDRSLTDYDEAIKLDPKNLQIYRRRGAVHEQKGSTSEAIADYQKVLELKPGDPTALAALERLGGTK